MNVLLISAGVAVVILAFWALVLWLFARADRPHLEREQLEKVFGEERR